MFKKHPRGIAVIFFAEMWERFGFYTLMAIFVLYMDKEFGWSDTKKGDFYGWFLGAVYFTPIFGGWIADRILGQKKTIQIGAVLMIIGFSALASSSLNMLLLFYLGLIFVAIGTGLFKVNMAVSVGNLYYDNVHLKDAGYNIYYMGVNLGAAFAPLTATVLFNLYGSYRISFWAAAIGMLFSTIIFLAGQKYLLESKNAASISPAKSSSIPDEKNSMPAGEDRQRILTLCILFIIVIFFWIAFYQNGFALTLFAERSTIQSDILRPETYQFFNPLFILLLTPFLLGLFASLAKKGKEPETPVKIFLGMGVMGLSMMIMVFGSLAGGNLDQNIMSPAWLISTYFVGTLAEILISPMGLSYVSKVSPAKVQGLMMGMWFGATALGGYGSGLLGKFYSDFSHHQYFLIITGLLAFSAILVLIFMKKLRKFST